MNYYTVILVFSPFEILSCGDLRNNRIIGRDDVWKLLWKVFFFFFFPWLLQQLTKELLKGKLKPSYLLNSEQCTQPRNIFHCKVDTLSSCNLQPCGPAFGNPRLNLVQHSCVTLDVSQRKLLKSEKVHELK